MKILYDLTFSAQQKSFKKLYKRKIKALARRQKYEIKGPHKSAGGSAQERKSASSKTPKKARAQLWRSPPQTLG